MFNAQLLKRNHQCSICNFTTAYTQIQYNNQQQIKMERNYEELQYKQVFTNYKHWHFDKKQQQAQSKIDHIAQNLRQKLPALFYTPNLLSQLGFIQDNHLHKVLLKMPKAVMHHNHLQCNADYEFCFNYIVHDPRVYLSADLHQVHLGTKKDAEQKQWRSLASISRQLPSQKDLTQFIYSKISLSKKDHEEISGKKQIWSVFESKVQNFFPLIWAQDIFEKYLMHIFRKIGKNNYQKAELRAYIAQLTKYDKDGNLMAKLPRSEYLKIVDKCVQKVKNQYPDFEIGIIYIGIKAFSDQQNQKYFQQLLQLRWKRCIGVDFVNEQDQYGQLKKYDEILEKIFKKSPSLRVPKVYHAGESKDQKNKNIQIALDSGSARIGHGLNLTCHKNLMQRCKKICFQINPVSNLVLGYVSNPSDGIAPFLLQNGIPLSINPDDSGIFGYSDYALDFLVSLIGHNWTIRHIKLILFYSIQHSIGPKEEKEQLVGVFHKKWDTWITQVLQNTKIQEEN